MKKGYIIILVITVIYIGFALTINYIRENSIKYIVFPDQTCLQYDKVWKEIDIEKIPNKKFQLVQDGIKNINDKIIVDNILTIKNIELEGNMFAYRGANIDLLKYSISDINDNDYSYITSFLTTENLTFDINNIDISKKITIDLNNDNQPEDIYVLANYYSDDDLNLFVAIFIKSQFDYVILELDEFANSMEAYMPNIYILDIDNNKFSDIIIKKRYSSMIGQKLKIVSFEKDLNNYKITYEGGLK